MASRNPMEAMGFAFRQDIDEQLGEKKGTQRFFW